MNLIKSIMKCAFFAAVLLIPVSIALGQSVVDPPREITSTVARDPAFRVVQLVSGLDHPWSIAFMPDGGFLITERPGRLLLYREGISSGVAAESSPALEEIGGLPRIIDNGQGGLLDVILHPDYEHNGWIYLTYSSRYGFGHGTTLVRARLQGAELVDLEELFRMSGPTLSGRHFGSRLVFATDGTLFMTIGERGSRDRAQDLGDHAGSVLRFNDDGTIPADNPFVGQNGARPEIYSYGHRNAQGMALNPWTGEIWLHEHGPRGGDEINIVRPGLNYGWPVVSFGLEYASGRQVGEGTSKPGMEESILHWTPSIAPSGMTFYDADVFDAWSGDIFAGALAGKHLRRVDLEDGEVVAEEILLQDVVGRIRDVRTGPDGLLYLITDEDSGGLYRLEPGR